MEGGEGDCAYFCMEILMATMRLDYVSIMFVLLILR